MEITIHAVKVDGKDYAIVGGGITLLDTPDVVVKGKDVAADPKKYAADLQKILAVPGQKCLIPLAEYKAKVNEWLAKKKIPHVKTPDPEK